MALLLLLRQGGVHVHALTVDHGLRRESADEAAQVAQWCNALAIPHSILVWKHDRIDRAIQQQARDARYRLMLDWCHAHSVRYLLTAHHLDDQIETFMFRLLRESRVDGLASIQPVSQRESIFLCRPLLAFPKSRLEATVVACAHPWIEDPSNANYSFTRVALRGQLEGLDDATKARISQLTIFFHKFRNHLENKLSKSINLVSTFHPAGYAIIDQCRFLEQPEELRFRIAQHFCMLISGDATPLRTPKIARLAEALANPARHSKMTLHGVVFQYQAAQQNWLVMREKKHIAGACHLSFAPQRWDGRFLVSGSAPNPAAYKVGALGNHAHAFSKLLSQSAIPKMVWPTLPAFFHLEECVAVPHIQWRSERSHTNEWKAVFIPAKSLAESCSYAMNQEENLSEGECARA